MSTKLELDTEEMRKLGYRTVDILVDHFEKLKSKKVTKRGGRKQLEAIFREPIPEQGSDPFMLLDRAESEIFGNIMHLDHPRFFAFVSSPGNYISVLGDFLASGFNVFSGTWLESSGPSQIELVTISWLTEIFGLPENTSGGIFLSGGSMANMTALVLARENILTSDKRGVVYCSDQTHSSVEKAMKILGNEKMILRKVLNLNFRMDTQKLQQCIAEDKQQGYKPICIIANAGTTNTGTIDDLKAVSDICKKEKLWFHVDGAYGGVAILCDSQKKKYEGIEWADSITIDPHKWLFQPFEIGSLLVRDSSKLKDAFYMLPEYLKDIDSPEEEINYSNYGMQLTRGFRAFKLWFSLKTFGLDNFRKAIARGIELAELIELEVRKHDHWEIVTPAQLGIINFRFFQNGWDEIRLNDFNQEIIDRVVESGFAMISSTILYNKKVIRLCTINPRTTTEDIQQTIMKMNEIVFANTIR